MAATDQAGDDDYIIMFENHEAAYHANQHPPPLVNPHSEQAILIISYLPVTKI